MDRYKWLALGAILLFLVGLNQLVQARVYNPDTLNAVSLTGTTTVSSLVVTVQENINPSDLTYSNTSSLTIGTGTFQTGTIAGFFGSSTSFLQLNLQNNAGSASSSADYVLTANNGNTSQFYTDFFENSSGYNNASDTVSGANDGGIIVNGGNLVMGTQSSSASLIKFHIGGLLTANLVGGWSNTQFWVGTSTQTIGLTVNGISTLATTTITSSTITYLNSKSVTTTGNITFGGNLLPATNNANDLGALGTQAVRNIFASGTSFVFNALPSNAATDNLVCWSTTNGQLNQEATSCTISSLRFKDNLSPFSSGLKFIEGLQTITYDEVHDGKVTNPNQVGFAAENIDLLDPHFVVFEPVTDSSTKFKEDYAEGLFEKDPSDFPSLKKARLYVEAKIRSGKIPKTVDYAKMTVAEAKAIQELQKEIIHLKALIKSK